MIYLATPYSDPDESVREQRYQDACRLTAVLMRRKLCSIFSPIVHSHPLLAYGIRSDFAFWSCINDGYLLVCSQLWVARFPGWDKSIGIKEEIEVATIYEKPIIHIDPSDWLE